MPIQEAEKIWKNGKFIPWSEANTHIMTQGLHYGSAAWDGARAYDTKHKGTCIFRNRDHVERLFFSASVYRIPIDPSIEEVMQISKDVVRENKLSSAYIRPLAYMDYGEIGPAMPTNPHSLCVIAFPFGSYLGADGMANGVDVCVSSWRRPPSGTIPMGAKVSGNYLSSRLISMEAKERGFAEGIALAHDGTLSEGAGANLFVVKNGRLLTPTTANSILEGITRDTIITLAGELGIEVVEQPLPREILYSADEIFMTGTAAEVTPIRSVDKIQVGDGNRPVTTAIEKAFFGLMSGETEDKWGWLDPVE